MQTKTVFSVVFSLLILAATSLTSQAQLIWTVGLDDNGWPVGDGGGANASFVQENGTINDLPGVPNSPEVNQQADNDYYFAGVYTNVIASVTNFYGDYTPVGVVAVNEEAAERAFAGADNDLRYHFNLPSTLKATDQLAVTFDANNLDDPSAVNTDPRYGIEVYFNGHLVQSQIVIHPADLDTNYTTPYFSLASVNAQVGPGFDNIVSLKGTNYNAEGGGNWMGIDFVQLNGVTNTNPPPPALVWAAGIDDDGWPAGTGGGTNTSFVQENGTINDLPGSPDSTSVAHGADNDYYFAGVYTNVIASVTNFYGDYTPVGVVAVNEEAAERAFAADDNDLRYHFNLPSSLKTNDQLTVTFDALNLDDPSAVNTDPRYGIEVYFNGVLVQPQILVRPVDLGTDYTTPRFSLASVNAQVGPGFDNIVSLKGVNYNAEGGGNWMGIDYVQLNSASATVAPPAVSVPANLAISPPTSSGGGSLKGEYWKRPINTIHTDGATNPTNRVDNQIDGFGTPAGTFQAKKFVYLGNDLTPITTWLTNDAPSFVGATNNLDDGAFRFTGYINVATAGTIKLGTTSDDGSRITIGGIDVINNDSGHGDATVDTNVVFAAAGLYPIEITYFNGDWTSDGTGANLNHSGSTDPTLHGGANFHLRVAGADVTTAGAAIFHSTAPVVIVPADLAVIPPVSGAGGGNLKGEYWKRPINTILTDGATNPTNRVDAQIDGFGTPDGTFQAKKFVYLGNDLTPISIWLTNDAPSFVGATNNLDDGAFRFTGFLNVTNPGTIKLGTTSDDGSRITIGGIDVINNDSGHGDATIDTNVVFSAAGLYPIEITYFNGDWTSDGTGANLNHSGSTDPTLHGGANFHLRVAGADVTTASAAIFRSTAPVVIVPGSLAVGPSLSSAGGSLKGEYWKRPINTILTDGATNPTNRVDTQIDGFGTANGTFQATKFVYLGNDLTPISNWLTNDAPSFVGATNNLDDGAFRFTGFINVTNPGIIKLGTTSDDGSRITIGGIDVINNDSGHGDATIDTNVVFSAAGLYPIEITYFNGDWTSDGTGANLNHSGSTDPTLHGGANFHLRVGGADVTAAGMGMFFSTGPVVPYKIGLNFGADQPNTSLAATDVAGVPAVAQANWNNISGLTGTNTTIVADSGGAPVPTTVSVVWDSNNTWASTGIGEENNQFPTNSDRRLMTGYLDTGDATTSHVTITNIPSALTSTGYDLYLYGMGGVGGRGGGYRILDAATKAVLNGYILATSPTNATNYLEVPQNLAATAHGVGNYIVVRGLTAPGITIEATTTAPRGSGTPPRAPLNAVQLVPAAPATDTIANGLVAYWNFDGNLLDSVKDFNGTARGTNPVAFVDGKTGFGKAIQLDGTDQFIEITGGNEDELEFPKGSMSISGWFKVGAFDKGWQALIAKGENSNYRVARRDPTDKIAYAGGVGEGADDVPPVKDGQWHHFVAISDATGSTFGTALYLDGVKHGVMATKPVLTGSTNHLFIGENPDARGRQWNGEIDDIAIWNRVLTPGEITALYSGGAGTPLSAIANIPGGGGPAVLPADFGQTVNGFQDDFTGATRDPDWQAFGPGGDRYDQIDGILYVSPSIGDPNHLLYVKPGYSNNVQEVLARIRATAFGPLHDYPRGGLAVGVQTNPTNANANAGYNLHFRDSNQDNVTGRQFKLLDDARAWGPPGLRTNIPGQTTPGWTNNVWYWLRLRVDPKADGTNDLFGKVWVADGITPEPADWQLTWKDSAIPKPLRSGLAGIAGSSVDANGNGLAHFEVDYILIKAEGLPQIKVDFQPLGPPPTVPEFIGITQLANKKLQIEWIGAGTLEQADNVAGPWTAVPAASALGIITPTGASKFYRLHQP